MEYLINMDRKIVIKSKLGETYVLIKGSCQKHLEGGVPQNRVLRPKSTDPPRFAAKNTYPA